MQHSVLPIIRYLILSEGVQLDPARPRWIALLGILSSIRSQEQPAYPLLYKNLYVFLQLTSCRNSIDGRVQIQHADTAEIIFTTKSHTIDATGDPLEVIGVVFRIHNVLFRKSGMYWVQFWYDDTMLAQQPLLLR